MNLFLCATIGIEVCDGELAWVSSGVEVAGFGASMCVCVCIYVCVFYLERQVCNRLYVDVVRRPRMN